MTHHEEIYNEENSLTMPQRMECSVILLYSSEPDIEWK